LNKKVDINHFGKSSKLPSRIFREEKVTYPDFILEGKGNLDDLEYIKKQSVPLQAACDIEDDTPELDDELDLSPGGLSDPKARKHTIRCQPADEIPDETGRFTGDFFSSPAPLAMKKTKTSGVPLPKTVLTDKSLTKVSTG
jgi:hypothetical protein